ncbi:hypothetical protein FIBSPDRAFT_1043663 [Athelia psychrophila]|uniref:EGF-like domain-containing protein n=1 Tax=Athelia psychrophila TaxID=1759441 RepID=A0A166KQW6_9AGAM|nr:hypothetical protein FIBSPDRAFT_1043663 [Fibularhizoctonia sp. CBS 109695]
MCTCGAGSQGRACKLGSSSSIGWASAAPMAIGTLGTIEDEGVRTIAARYLKMGQALKVLDIFKLITEAKEFEDTHNEALSDVERQ